MGRTVRATAPRLRTKDGEVQPVSVIKVAPVALATALALAKGDARRIRIISATEVDVINVRLPATPAGWLCDGATP